MNLDQYIDNDYKLYIQKICKTKYKILGIKIPILKKIALNNYQLNNFNNNYLEHILIKGIIIANLDINYTKRLKLIDNYLPLIDNWEVCDTFCSELKFVKNHLDDFLIYLENLNKEKEYYLRFYIVMLLNYYLNDKYIDYILNHLIIIKSDHYYANMAIAWCYSKCLVKYFTKTFNFLQNNQNKINKWLYNKALQKGIESLQISKSNKLKLKNAKR